MHELTSRTIASPALVKALLPRIQSYTIENDGQLHCATAFVWRVAPGGQRGIAVLPMLLARTVRSNVLQCTGHVIWWTVCPPFGLSERLR